nr:DNA-primase RepB domain-containing protein [uncultured Desulfobulbus sp.]
MEEKVTVPATPAQESTPRPDEELLPPLVQDNITNEKFISAIIPDVKAGTSVVVCSKPGDPTTGGWPAQSADSANLPDTNNNYFVCSTFRPCDDGSFKVRKEQFVACYGLLLDDVGTKVPLDQLGDFLPSCLIETSPSNYQALILFKEPVTDLALLHSLLDALIAKGLCDPGATGPATRWARLPNGINGKEKYRDEKGEPFRCNLTQWNPERRYTPDEIIAGLRLELPEKKEVGSRRIADDVFTPQANENPVITALKNRGLYKTPLGSGKHDITCPWVQEHTDQLDNGAAYFEPDDVYPLGGFCCHHSHREQYHIKELLEYLGVPSSEARNKPVIRVVSGELHRVVDAAERELARGGNFYQYGGMIASVSTDPSTGNPSIAAIGMSALTRQLSVIAIWEKSTSGKGWTRCDPPTRHTSILYDSKHFQYLPPLAGVARQPYFRESDGGLVIEPGYDERSKMFGVFDPRQFSIPQELSFDAAQAALVLLEDLLVEFHFVSPADKSAALSAIFTAVVRPTLPHAPAFHVKAPSYGSGKSYLCELIGAFASPGSNAKVSYPKTSEEASKAILSLLLTNPAVIEFDDMDTDWIPHGIVLRTLTAENITDRILGYSKTATVSTRTLFLGSGNNVGPVRDLLRRVLTIQVDPRSSTPATIQYQGTPVEQVRKERGKYVAAVLTIIQAWRQCGAPKTEVESIVSFGGAWSDYCRQPLLWLGCPDPASTLLEQVKHDPDADALGCLMFEWRHRFGSAPTTVRKAVAAALDDEDLMDALREFPVEEKGFINRSKLGWVLKKNANRIVNGFEFQKAEADGRTAWRVVEVTKEKEA